MSVKRFAILFAAFVLPASGGCERDSQRSNGFSQPRLNDGIEVGAPDSWRWARDGISKAALRVLAGEPRQDSGQVWLYDANIAGTSHKLLFDEGGFLVGCTWYDGLQPDRSLDTPHPVSLEKLKIDFPRCAPMAWEGESSNGYQVEVYIRMGPDAWTSDGTYFTTNNVAVHQHTGMNAGRWRVRKLSLLGYGPWSEDVEFECIK
jgi:hypothetical protein